MRYMGAEKEETDRSIPFDSFVIHQFVLVPEFLLSFLRIFNEGEISLCTNSGIYPRRQSLKHAGAVTEPFE